MSKLGNIGNDDLSREKIGNRTPLAEAESKAKAGKAARKARKNTLQREKRATKAAVEKRTEEETTATKDKG